MLADVLEERGTLLVPACVPQLSRTSAAYAYLQVRKATGKVVLTERATGGKKHVPRST